MEQYGVGSLAASLISCKYLRLGPGLFFKYSFSSNADYFFMNPMFNFSNWEQSLRIRSNTPDRRVPKTGKAKSTSGSGISVCPRLT